MNSSAAAVAPKRLEAPSVSSSSRAFPSPGQQTLLSCLVLAAVVFVCYSPVRQNGFLNYDDESYITNNAHVRAGLSWATVKWAATAYDEANWAPLSWLSHALDYQLFGLNPAGHHFESVLLHAASAVLLFLLLQSATGFRWRSLMVAALFALHPINVESVAWAAERKNVLSMLFFMLALYAYTWYTRKPGVLRYAVLFCLFALGLLTKSQIIAFPFLLWLWDYWPLCRIFPPAGSQTRGETPHPGIPTRWWKGLVVWEKAPLLLLSAASAVITIKAEKAGGAVAQYSVWLRLETAAISYAHYLLDALWPARLVALYPHPTRLYPLWQVGAAVLALLLVTASVLRARQQRYLVAGWFWFLGSLVPMIGLVQVGPQARADRFAYLPLIGVFFMSTWLVADWAQARKIPAPRLAVLSVIAVVYVLVLGACTYRQVGYWHDIPSFWQRTLALTKDNYIAENNLGIYLFSQGRAEDAAAHFRSALAIRPDNLIANMNLGAYEDSRGHMPAAIERYRMVALHAPDMVMRAGADANLGFAYRQMGDSTTAKRYFETAATLAPDRIRPLIGLGLIAEQNGDLAEAIRQYSHAAAVRPTDVGYFLLAQALQQAGRKDEAKAISGRIADLAEAQKTAEAFFATAGPQVAGSK
ncbi:MAG: tetratricopeptide repeat protein [Terriglobales bacterium]